MAFTAGSAKALAEMMSGEEGYREWFPETFEVTPERVGLAGDGGGDWEEVVPSPPCSTDVELLEDPEWERV